MLVLAAVARAEVKDYRFNACWVLRLHRLCRRIQYGCWASRLAGPALDVLQHANLVTSDPVELWKDVLPAP